MPWCLYSDIAMETRGNKYQWTKNKVVLGQWQIRSSEYRWQLILNNFNYYRAVDIYVLHAIVITL